MLLERITLRYTHSLPLILKTNPYRRIYYAYLYAYLRHEVREKLNVPNIYYWIDLEKRIPLQIATNDDLYMIVVSAFQENDVNTFEGKVMVPLTPSLELVESLVNLLRDKTVYYDTIVNCDSSKDISIFMTDEIVFLVEDSYSLDNIEYFFRWYQFKQEYPSLIKMGIIGITDSTLTMVQF